MNLQLHPAGVDGEPPAPAEAAAPDDEAKAVELTATRGASASVSHRRASIDSASTAQSATAAIQRVSSAMRATEAEWKFDGWYHLGFCLISGLLVNDYGIPPNLTHATATVIVYLVFVLAVAWVMTDPPARKQLPFKWVPTKNPSLMPPTLLVHKACVRNLFCGIVLFVPLVLALIHTSPDLASPSWLEDLANGGLSDSEQVQWDAFVDEHVATSWPDFPHEEFSIRGEAAYADDFLMRVLQARVRTAAGLAFGIHASLAGGALAVVLCWTPTASWSTEAITESAKLLFDERFVQMFVAIEAEADKLQPDVARLKGAGYAAAILAAVSTLLFTEVASSTTEYAMFFEPNMVSLKVEGTSEIHGPLFHAFEDAGAAEAAWIIFVFYGVGVPWIAAMINGIYLNGIVLLERNAHRMALVGRMVDCFASERHSELAAVPESEVVGLITPVVSVTVASDLLQWHELRSFIRSTTMRRDLASAKMSVQGCMLGALSIVTYLALTTIVFGKFGDGGSGIFVATILPVLAAFGLHLLHTMAAGAGWTASHIDSLRANQRQLLLELVSGASLEEGDERLEKSCTAIDSVCDYIEVHDSNPSILGVQITPSVTSVALGYLGTGTIAVATTLLST